MVALSSFRPLRSRNFALVWSAALVSNVGSWMQTVALGFVITARTHNPLWTGLVAAAAFLPMGLLAPLGGALADRLDRRRWLIITTVAEACFAAALAVLAATGHAQPAVLVGVAFLGGVAAAVGFPTYQAMLPDLVPREDLLAAVSLSSAQFNLGRVIGPALAGIVLVIGSDAWAFAVNAASFGAVVVALVFVRLPAPKASTLPAEGDRPPDRGRGPGGGGRTRVSQRHSPDRRGGPHRLAVHRSRPRRRHRRSAPGGGSHLGPGDRPGDRRRGRGAGPGPSGPGLGPTSTSGGSSVRLSRRHPRLRLGPVAGDGHAGHRRGRHLLHRRPDRPEHRGPAARPRAGPRAVSSVST